ncbi:hypothetical protein ACP70R_025170 [Stipagrostis hirtigluma subsp. patula]
MISLEPSTQGDDLEAMGFVSTKSYHRMLVGGKQST